MNYKLDLILKRLQIGPNFGFKRGAGGLQKFDPLDVGRLLSYVQQLKGAKHHGKQ